jgi:hypothetical protein
MSGRGRLRRLACGTGIAVLLAAAVAVAAVALASHERREPQLQSAASGALSIWNSQHGGAIFRARKFAPGHFTGGVVTIRNSGTARGSLSLTRPSVLDAHAPGRQNLSHVLKLLITDMHGHKRVYMGTLGAMPTIRLPDLRPGAAHTYRFVVWLPNHLAHPNRYQRTSISAIYWWRLTEATTSRAQRSPEATAPSRNP